MRLSRWEEIKWGLTRRVSLDDLGGIDSERVLSSHSLMTKG